MRRGDVLEHPLRGRRFVVVATQYLVDVGVVVVAEVAPVVPAGTRGMLAVQLAKADPVGGAVLAYRLNWLAADRLDGWKRLGRLCDTSVELVDMALRAALDL